ncbi:hypothetical protein GCM10014715_74630 [Streptomyces spiralis]|uniref:Ku domain-containing protein n=1 Tax=Streptomyces spiralis TaxID=66376 RepID=A0A919AHZ9_9ACTN|nr:Ku protein [Streptomyces spiralis]GHF07834.1 hypothetical protein GCM10014715_74630 [Streptomyces spiralis]
MRFHQYHLADQGRIRYKKICELEDREVHQSEIGNGYELSRDQVIPISDAELSNLPLPTARAIEIDAFVPLASIDPIRIGEGYYLAPNRAGGRETVQAAGRGVAPVVAGGCRQMGVARP